MFTRRSETSKPLESPLHPIAIRTEHIAKEHTRLYLRPKADPYSANEYTIKDDLTGSVVFSVTGKKYGSNSGREFRNSSGLPLFEIRRSIPSSMPHRVLLPGDKKEDLVKISGALVNRTKADMLIQNLAPGAEGSGGKETADSGMVKLVIQTLPFSSLLTAKVMAGDQKVADVRESMERNKEFGHITQVYAFGSYSLPPRRVLDISVAKDFDMSLAALVAVLLTDLRCENRLDS